MLGYTLRRLAATIPVMGVVALFVFSLLYLSPGDPAAIIAGDNATPENVAQIRKALGLDEPLWKQFLVWTGSLARGDLGKSMFWNEPVTTLTYRTAPLSARADNIGYHAFFLSGTFDRELTRFDRGRPIGDDNIPWIESRVTYLQVGPVAFISAPGELHADLWVGTRDPRWSWGQPTLTEMRNRPDLMQAAAPPYLRDVMLQNPGVRYAFVAGLTEDFLGYIVPRYNFVLHPTAPYIEEADGDHYEETNSVGPQCEEHLFQPMMSLARWRPPQM